MGKMIYDARDLTTASQDMLQRIDQAILAAAFKIRDEARQVFIEDGNDYKYHNDTHYRPLAEGIMVGKLKNSHSVVVHALGGNGRGSNLWKTRFFVGGTRERMTPHTKGMIDKIDSLNKSLQGNQNVLDNYINNAINSL